MRLEVDPRRIRTGLLWVTAVLVLASLVAVLIGMQTDTELVHRVVKKVDVDLEGNIPTWFSTALLLIASLLAAMIASGESGRGKVSWAVFSALLALFSLDEAASFHEGANTVLEPLDLSGIFLFAWVIPGTIAVVALGFLSVSFLRDLPSSTRRGLIRAGVLYVVGALGIEFIEGAIASERGEDNVLYQIVATTQEAIEMVAVILLIYVLLRHGSREEDTDRVTLEIDSTTTP